ncbi:DUF421 domain-containing protein [Halobacillus andaensis]|uniref:DUF421 domain-containing protein n=1 Tax=Halobacillus andaensis TaxID=1176239 RepID=A0A917B6N7_HALAA|nr:DUF421 domain-containing protein [Halobacillus andaensis]MBP2006499.1 uncharacterized membrane protein YcaP (DUF421 family) [Halobacillus andaensis]GGF27823.1 DUF421 domain-containing protein [Halobacillus andaensis]
MDFFSSQESLTIVQWALRALVGFIFLVFIAKIMGQRSISQLRFLDFVIALLIGNIMAHPLSDEGLGLTGSIVTMSVLVSLYLLGVFFTLRWGLLKKLFDPPPITLIEKGQINYQGLKKARITIENLLTELRKEKNNDIQKVALALWEPGGTISIFLDPKHQPLTPSDMGLSTKPFDLPRIIIREGKIHQRELEQLGKDAQWLSNQIKIKNVSMQDILLATVDHEGNLHICLYH